MAGELQQLQCRPKGGAENVGRRGSGQMAGPEMGGDNSVCHESPGREAGPRRTSRAVDLSPGQTGVQPGPGPWLGR